MLLAIAAALAFCLLAIVRPLVGIVVLVIGFLYLPAVQSLLIPQAGPMKDALVAGVVVGAGTHWLCSVHTVRATGPDSLLVWPAVGLGLVYIVNAGGAHDAGWLHTTRLVLEVIGLYLTGLVLGHYRPSCRRTVYTALVVASVPVAIWGVLQQVVGVSGLVGMGYVYGVEVRTLGGGTLRSFGTLGDPFVYAAVLTVALAVLVFAWSDIRLSEGVKLACMATLGAGLTVAFVRTSLVVALALGALLIAERWNGTAGFVLLGVVAAMGILLFGLRPQASEAIAVRAPSGPSLSLNGRVGVWAAAIPGWEALPFGRGVGQVGTGQARTLQGVVVVTQESRLDAAKTSSAGGPALAVDSMYFAVLADVGLVGAALLLGVLARCLAVCTSAVRDGFASGWVGLALSIVISVDGLTRNTLNAFPSGYLMFLVLGLAVASSAWPHPGVGSTDRAGCKQSAMLASEGWTSAGGPRRLGT